MDFEGILAIIITLLVICMSVFLAVFAIARLTFPGEVAKIEQLRADVVRVGVGANEDVIGQVTMWNQDIRSKQRYNRIPVIEWVVPDGWDDIKTIEIP